MHRTPSRTRGLLGATLVGGLLLVAAPAGAMPVVVGGGFGGVLFHEMTGHGLEADHIQKGASVYEGKLGEQVAAAHLDAFDDGRLPGEWGTDGIDGPDLPEVAQPAASTTPASRLDAADSWICGSAPRSPMRPSPSIESSVRSINCGNTFTPRTISMSSVRPTMRSMRTSVRPHSHGS